MKKKYYSIAVLSILVVSAYTKLYILNFSKKLIGSINIFFFNTDATTISLQANRAALNLLVQKIQPHNAM